MAAAMFALLFTAFLPKVGVKFPWVTYHWIAGIVLIASILFHIVHATFFMDFWSIWPDKTGHRRTPCNRLQPHAGANPRRRRAASPSIRLRTRCITCIIVLTGLSVAITGFFMMFRVRTPFFTRNPYLFGDMTWGMMYVLHGLAGVGLIALIMVHVYFACGPRNWKSRSR